MRSPRRNLALLVVVVAAAVVPILFPHPFLLSIATQALIWALLAASWDLLSGYTGQISFGHAGFFALGAYVAALCSKELGASAWIGLVAALVLTCGIGVVVGFPALRLRGHYLAIVTLAFAEIVQLVATNWTSLTGGPFGIHDFGGLVAVGGAPERQRLFVYAIVLGIVAAAILAMYLLCEWTRAGHVFRAIREDQVLAQMLGINTTVYKLLAFGASAAGAGLAGGLYAYVIQLVGPGIASALTSSMVIGMAVFGGLGTLLGPVLGAFVLFGASEALRFLGLVYNLVAVGLVIMVFVIFVPRGIAGLTLRGERHRSRADATPEHGTSSRAIGAGTTKDGN